MLLRNGTTYALKSVSLAGNVPKGLQEPRIFKGGYLMNNKNMAKLLLLTMLLAILWGAGCSKPAEKPSEEPAEKAKEPVTITVQMFSGPEAEAMAPTAEYWNQNYAEKTGITVQVISQSRMGYFEKVTSQLVAGLPDPDIIHPFSLEAGKLAPYLEPLDDYVSNPELFSDPEGKPYDLKDMYEAALSTVTIGDKLYMLPKDMSEVLLYYRKDLIPEPPETWDEVIDLAKRFTKKYNPDSPTPYGIALQGKYEMWNFCCVSEILWSFGAEYFKADGKEPDFNSQASINAFKVLEELAKADVLPPGTAQAEYPEVLASLQNGEAAMALQWNAAFMPLTSKDQSPLVYDKIEVAPPPGVKQPDGSIKRAMYVQTINLAINKNSKHKEEAFKFLAWACFGEGARIYAEKGGSSPLISIYESPGAPEPLPRISKWVKPYGKAAPPLADIAEIIMMGSKWSQKVMVKEASAEEAAKGLNDEVREFLKSRGYL